MVIALLLRMKLPAAFLLWRIDGPSFRFGCVLKIAEDRSGSSEFKFMGISSWVRTPTIAQIFQLVRTYTHRDYRDTTCDRAFRNYLQLTLYLAVRLLQTQFLENFNVPCFVYQGTDDGTRSLTNVDDYKTKYNGIDINARKRMSNNFMVNAGLTLQKQKANYDGGDSPSFYIGDGGLTGQVFPFDPTNLPFLE